MLKTRKCLYIVSVKHIDFLETFLHKAPDLYLSTYYYKIMRLITSVFHYLGQCATCLPGGCLQAAIVMP